MPAEAYAIGINLVANAEKVVSENNKIIASLGRVLEAAKNTQLGLNEMVASLRGAGRTAAALAEAMGRVATAARDAASASARIRVAPGLGGGGGGGPTVAPRPFTSTAMADVTAAVAADQASRARAALMGTPRIAHTAPLRLTYSGPSYDRDVLGGRNDYSPGVSGTGFVLGPGGPTISPGRPPPPPPGVPYTPYQSSGQGGALVVRPPGNVVPGQRTLNLGPRFRLPRMPALPSVGPYGALVGGYLGAHAVGDAYEQGIDVDDIIAKMQTMRVADAQGRSTQAFTPEMIAQSQAIALQMMRRTPGLGYAGGLDVILQTAGLLGDAKESMALAPGLSFDAQVLSRYGKGDAVNQVERAVQAGELTGLNGPNGKIDVPKLLNFVDRLTQTSVAMGGQLDLGKYLTGIRQFGLGSGGASLDFLTTDLPAYMKIMGEARAGTALSSLQQVMLGHTPNTRSAKVMADQIKLGLRDSRGNVRFQSDLTGDPNAYLTDVLAMMGQHGYTTRDQIIGELYKIFPRQTIDRLAGSAIFDQNLINKEVSRNRAQQAGGNAALTSLLQNAPGAQFQQFSEGLKAFEAVTTDAAMQPTITLIKRLTDAFYNATDYVKGHPNDVKMFVDDVDQLVKMLLGVAKLVGTVWSYLPAPLKSAAAGAIGGGIIGSVVPGPGTGFGAAVGGAAGLAKGLLNSVMPPLPKQPAQDYMVDGKLIHPQAYVTPAPTSLQPIQISLTLDGRQIAQSVTTHQVRAMSPSAMPGMQTWDMRSTPTPPGLVTA